MSSSGENVATEGEEEEEEEEEKQRFNLLHNRRNPYGEEDVAPPSSKEGGAAEGSEELTPYVAKCYGHLETLRKRKREQEDQVETLVEGDEVLSSKQLMMDRVERSRAENVNADDDDGGGGHLVLLLFWWTETFEQIETIMQEIMRGLQERHAVSHAQFEATESKLSRSLREHNRVCALVLSRLSFNVSGRTNVHGLRERVLSHADGEEA